MTKTMTQAEQEIVQSFELFEDWLDKYNHIIELGKELETIDPEYRKDQYLITGCQSQVWLQADYQDGLVCFKADSDAIITKGIVCLLLKVLSGRTPEEILNADLTYLDLIGLKEHLSPTRSNGLLSMIKQVKLYALAFKAKGEQVD